MDNLLDRLYMEINLGWFNTTRPICTNIGTIDHLYTEGEVVLIRYFIELHKFVRNIN